MILQCSFAMLLFVAKIQCEICTEAKCTYELEIRQRRSMSYTDSQGYTYNVAWNATAERLQIIANSFHQPIVIGPFPSNASLIGAFLDPEDVITTDGTTRNIYVINEQYPGPTLEVMEGTEVTVNFVNHLHTEGVTIHFHGQIFRNNVWMDGVQYITQCPILPGTCFEYKFIAEPAGTYFYHAHSRNMRIDGIFGGFIVHKQIPVVPYHVVTVQDFYHEDATTLRVTNPNDPVYRGTGEGYLFSIFRDFTVDGFNVNTLAFDSALIDGRGRMDSTNLLPLATYSVTTNSRHRFRMINAGAEDFYEIMIDSHVLEIMALDGQEITPITVDSFVIAPGERVDFEVDTNAPPGRYWIRVELFREGVLDVTALPDIVIISDGIIKGANAILSYGDDTDTSDPTTIRRVCTSTNPCTIFNCPYEGNRPEHFKNCLTINEAQSAATEESLSDMFGILDTEVEEYFLNFGFQRGPSVNSRNFIFPAAPFSQDNSVHIVPCDDTECTTGCRCTNLLDLPFNKTIQLVLINYFPARSAFSHHAIHMHGHTFAVMASGYSEFDPVTARSTSANDDILCDSGLCPNASWNGLPPAFSAKPVLKDTVIVPARGYVVIRFRSNNPGFWSVHCHQERHAEEGMFVVLREAVDMLPPVPQNFPICGNFKFDADCPTGDSAIPVLCPNGYISQDLKSRPFNYFYKLNFFANGNEWSDQKEKEAIAGSGKSVWMKTKACLRIKPTEDGMLKKMCARTKFADAVIFEYNIDDVKYQETVIVDDKQVFTTNCFNCGLPLIEKVRSLAICFSATQSVKLEDVEASMCALP